MAVGKWSLIFPYKEPFVRDCLGFAVLSLLALTLIQCSDDASKFNVRTSLSAGRAAQAGRDCDRSRYTCTGGPERLLVKLYRAYISQNKDCTNPVLVTDNGSTGASVSLGVDTLIAGNPEDGTYHCLILVMSDNLTFFPDAAAAAAFPSVCTQGTASTFDIYRTDSGDAGLWKDMDGNAITATGAGATAGDNTIVIFGSTDTTILQAGHYAPHANQTLDLSGPLTVPGQTTFFADFSNGITEADGVCKIEGGTGMGFR